MKIQEGISLIKEWIEFKRKEYQDNTDFNELIRVINEIEKIKTFQLMLMKIFVIFLDHLNLFL